MVGVSTDKGTTVLFESDEMCWRQLVTGWPIACILATTPAAAETMEVWQLNGSRTAPVSAENTFAVPSTVEPDEVNGIPPAKCHDWDQASSEGLVENPAKFGEYSGVPHDLV